MHRLISKGRAAIIKVMIAMHDNDDENDNGDENDDGTKEDIFYVIHFPLKAMRLAK